MNNYTPIDKTFTGNTGRFLFINEFNFSVAVPQEIKVYQKIVKSKHLNTSFIHN